MNYLKQNLPYVSALAAVGLFVVATFFYQGGTNFNPMEPRYLWHVNSISEAMMTVGYNSIPIVTSRILTIAAVLLLVLTLCLWLFRSPQQNTSSNIFAYLAVTGIAGAVLLPANLYPQAHNYSFALGILFLTCSICALTISALQNKQIVESRVLSLLSTLLVLYCIFLTLNPTPSVSESVKIAHAISQKIVVLAILCSSLYLTAKRANASNT
jgi:hypothetical protein